jgi:hypothetical protein
MKKYRKIICAEKNCETCKKLFLVYWCRRESAKFCSNKCYLNSKDFKGFEKGHKVYESERSIASRFQKRKGFWMSMGYKMIYMPNHPNARVDGGVSEHRLVMEKKIGRLLKSSEHVHHLNSKRSDNRPENLIILSSHDHYMLHNKKENA